MGKGRAVALAACSLVALLILGAALSSLIRSSPGSTADAYAVVGAWFALMLVAAYLMRRQDARTRWDVEMRTHRVEEAITLAHPVEVVWELLYDPERTPLIDPDCARGYRVPDSPLGVGEQHASVDHDGAVSVVEVLEIDPPRRAVFEHVSPVPDYPIRVTYALEPVDGGCVLSQRVDLDLPDGAAVDTEATAAKLRTALVEHLQRVKAALEPA